MRKPPPLKPGDLIRVVSPASPIDRVKVQAGVALLESAGYRLSFGTHAFDTDAYLAGDDLVRAADLQSAFDDPDAAAVLCSRGGYGTSRLLHLLDLDRMAASGKAFVGFSDLTVLHLALNRRGLATYHAPMLLTFVKPRPPWVAESFFGLLRGVFTVPEAAPSGQCLVPGTAEGVLTGGCLCLLCDSLATPDPMAAAGKIVLIEDVDEPPHRVDAMLTHLIRADVLTRAAGIVVGEMTATDERPDASIGGRPWREIVHERIAPLGIPAIVGYPFGHANMLSLPLGFHMRLDAAAGTLASLE